MRFLKAVSTTLAIALFSFVSLLGAAAQAASPDAGRMLEFKNLEVAGTAELNRLIAKPASDPSRISNAEAVRKIGLQQKLFHKTDSNYLIGGESFLQHILVSNSAELQRAFYSAKPGDLIELAPDTAYWGNFKITQNGTAENPIALVGPRSASLTTGVLEGGYGIHLTASHWRLIGFSVENSGNGIVADNATNNVIRGIELSGIGHEAIHLKQNSSNNFITRNYIHHTGLVHPYSGRGVEIGSEPARLTASDISNSTKSKHTEIDASNSNSISSNLIGPGVPAEHIKLNKSTSAGVVTNNTFITDENRLSDSWIHVYGTDYVVRANLGASHATAPVVRPVRFTDGQANENRSDITRSYSYNNELTVPYMAKANTPSVLTLMVPSRSFPYTLSELMALSPETLIQLDDNTLALNRSILMGPGSTLNITNEDARRIRLRSDDSGHVGLLGLRSNIKIEGSQEQPLIFDSWHPDTNEVDLDIFNGRSYVSLRGGRMDIDHASFLHLGYEEGTVSGVSWKSALSKGITYLTTGNVHNTVFEGNLFGAYTFEAVDMKWTKNIFRNNIQYGFDPHDFSNRFIFEDNIAHHNGSHGIIFSRGCDDNIIRRNHSYNNAGHGVMIDDGHFDPNASNLRHRTRVPSNRNIIENNVLTDNLDGVVIEGGSDNVIRANTISGIHRYGIRLKDHVSKTRIADNDLNISKRAGLLIDNESNNNSMISSVFKLAPVGLILRNSHGNKIEGNTYEKLTRSVAYLEGDVSETDITSNVFIGRGSEIVRSDKVNSIDVDYLQKNNDLTQWISSAPALIANFGISVWFSILVFPLLLLLYQLLTRARHSARMRSTDNVVTLRKSNSAMSKMQSMQKRSRIQRRRAQARARARPPKEDTARLECVG